MPTEDAYSSGHLVLSHFGTCICSNVETNLSWTCFVSGLLNSGHPSVLLFCLHVDFVQNSIIISIIKVVWWNRKTFLFSFCFLFLLLFSFLYRLDWFRDISFVFHLISCKLGRLIDKDKKKCCLLFHGQRSKVKVTKSQTVFDFNFSIDGQRKITL